MIGNAGFLWDSIKGPPFNLVFVNKSTDYRSTVFTCVPDTHVLALYHHVYIKRALVDAIRVRHSAHCVVRVCKTVFG